MLSAIIAVQIALLAWRCLYKQCPAQHSFLDVRYNFTINSFQATSLETVAVVKSHPKALIHIPVDQVPIITAASSWCSKIRQQIRSPILVPSVHDGREGCQLPVSGTRCVCHFVAELYRVLECIRQQKGNFQYQSGAGPQQGGWRCYLSPLCQNMEGCPPDLSNHSPNKAILSLTCRHHVADLERMTSM